ncbi:outer membrane lipoprotein carrier protein LolA [Rhodobacterales bacterium HKCCE2091]|nr:outer membrane lipoprotein carrier protein LolA [Rhodobacterales bacterium HKCCE2091]
MKSLMLAAAVVLAALPAAAQNAIPLNALSNYINGISTAEGSFTQVNSDGTVSTGRIYMHRPGRVRFEYDGADSDLLVLAGAGTVAIFDGRGSGGPEQYPLSETPLSLILDRNVNLARSGMVIAHDGDGTTTRVVAQDPDRPEIGQIALLFTDDPVELRQWVITDGSGQETTVILGGLETGMRLPASLFSINNEIANR